MTVLRKSLFWYRPEATRAAAHAAGRLPCFAFDGPTGFFYGFPAIDERGVKIAEHTGGTPVADPLSLDRGIDAREQARVEAVLADHLPNLRGRPSLRERPTAHSACLYTMSPDGHFVVGLHPRHPNVTIAAGFSGHGFKFASVIGEVLADLALQGKTGHPIGFLSPQRFASA
jgi:glycine/D-amino acid oxidase-like deaminating enzyme